MVTIEFCPACKSRNVQFQSATPVAGLTNVLYHCLDCGAFITRNEWSQPMVQYVVDSKTRRPIKLDRSHKSSSQGDGCCNLAIFFVLILTLSIVIGYIAL